jgi:hypothetical protein
MILASLTLNDSFLMHSNEEERKGLYSLQYEIGKILNAVLQRVNSDQQVVIFTTRPDEGDRQITAIFKTEDKQNGETY